MRRVSIAVCAFVLISACSRGDHEHQAGHQSAQNTAPPIPADVPAGSYALDKAHASLIFRVDHLGFSNFTARFKRFDAELEFDPENLAVSSVTATVDPRSIETDYPNPAVLDFNAQLQGESWLSSAQYPQMTFRSAAVDVTGAGTMRIHGELTLRGMTRPVTLDATLNGGYAGHPLDPNARIGFSARGSLRRSDYGMTFGLPAPGSRMGVGDAVEIIIEAEFTGPPWADAPDDAPAAAS
ncbi:MAG: YceI family protein [Woeseiaceae bacterium]